MTDWHLLAAQAADDKLARDTVVLSVGDVLGITEFFVITSGGSKRQVKAIVNEVEAQVKTAGGPKPLRIEGIDTCSWVLMDFGEFIVHVFDEEVRAYYELERLWADRPTVEWKTAGTNAPRS